MKSGINNKMSRKGAGIRNAATNELKRKNVGSAVNKVRSQEQILRELIVECGAIDRVNELLSTAYMLITLACRKVDDCSDILHAFHLEGGQQVVMAKKLQRSFDDYLKNFYSIMRDQERYSQVAGQVINDVDRLERAFYHTFKECQKDWKLDIERTQAAIDKLAEKYGQPVEFDATEIV